MTKEELVPLLNPNDDNVHTNWWKVAFELYTVDNPNHKLKVGCKSCRKTVYKWLRK